MLRRAEVLSIDALACTVLREVWLSWRVSTEQLSLPERVVVRYRSYFVKALLWSFRRTRPVIAARDKGRRAR
jgi:hypothetical protein